MSQLRVVVLTAVAFVAAGFGSVAMAGCGGDNGCGGARGGLLSRLHSKKAACGGAVAKDCSGGGMLNKLGSRRGSKCSGAAVSNCAPAPAPACNSGCNTGCNSGCNSGCGSAVVSSDCNGCGTVSSEPVMVGSAPCTNCSGTVNAGTVESSSVAPPTPAASSAPAVPTAPAVPAAPVAPASASDVPKA